MDFTFITAGSIRFGLGRVKELSEAVEEHGARVFLVTGANRNRHAEALASIEERVVDSIAIESEPAVDTVRAGAAQLLSSGADVIVAIGGGSVLDYGKAIGVVSQQSGDITDYLEVIGNGQTLSPHTIPVIAVPTTSGTGSEVTMNSVVYSPEHQVKVSLRSPAMIPAVALVDPGLTVEVPPRVTATSGLDALTQCLEPFTSKYANPLTDVLAIEGLHRAGTGLELATLEGDHLQARIDMSLCSLLGGLSLANAKLGVVHAFAAALGGMLQAPHGAICGSILPAATAANLQALSDREPTNPALDRYARATEALCGVRSAAALEGWLMETCRVLDVPGLRDLGLTADRIDEACEKAARSSSMKGNPIELTPEELRFVCEASM